MALAEDILVEGMDSGVADKPNMIRQAQSPGKTRALSFYEQHRIWIFLNLEHCQPKKEEKVTRDGNNRKVWFVITAWAEKLQEAHSSFPHL